jgi:hypothetical protein
MTDPTQWLGKFVDQPSLFNTLVLNRPQAEADAADGQA